MTCAPPTTTAGGTFTCAGQRTNFNEQCTLTCGDGYTGGETITCNSHNNDGTVTWSSMPTCTSKPREFVNKTVSRFL